jgi:hypothetical protein
MPTGRSALMTLAARSGSGRTTGVLTDTIDAVGDPAADERARWDAFW